MEKIKRIIQLFICAVLAVAIAVPDATAFASETTSKPSGSTTVHKTDKATTSKSKPQRTKLTGLITEKALYPTSTMTDSITITPAHGRNVYLQRRLKSGKWKTIVKYVTRNTQSASLTLKYPRTAWKDIKSTVWRVFIPATKTGTELKSENVLLYTRNRAKLNLKCKRAVVMNASTHRVLYDKKMNESCSQASITKVMTALLAIENNPAKKIMTITKKAERTPWTYIPIREGDTVRMSDLLYAALLPSSNGSATALAEGTAGSTFKFAKMMNAKAKELELTNTHYITPHGLTEEGHVTTAFDQALLMCYAAKNKTFMKVVGTKKHSFTTLKKHERCSVTTTNKLLGSVPGVKGGKTGTTDAAGCCFAGIYKHNGQTYVTVVLGCSKTEYRWDDTKKLLRYIRVYGW